VDRKSPNCRRGLKKANGLSTDVLSNRLSQKVVSAESSGQKARIASLLQWANSSLHPSIKPFKLKNQSLLT
jgi:hypothetical protein